MKRDLRALLAAGALSLALSGAGAALAQKPGGILKMYNPDSGSVVAAAVASAARFGS